MIDFVIATTYNQRAEFMSFGTARACPQKFKKFIQIRFLHSFSHIPPFTQSYSDIIEKNITFCEQNYLFLL